MAKGSAMGLWKGKKGSSVFYKITNSSNGQQQGIRERTYDVANPQTTAQAAQRIKLLPAQRVAGAIREVVERSFQGIKYGSRSRSEFLKYALSMDSGFPYVLKDDSRIVPGKYLVSKGTLAPIDTYIEDAGAYSSLILSTGDRPTITTIGQLSETIIRFNPYVQDGDQITLVACTTTSGGSTDIIDKNFTWFYSSFYLDVASSASVSTAFGNGLVIDVEAQSETLQMYVLSAGSSVLDQDIVAAAFILSRPSSSGDYLRSTNSLVINESLLEPWFSDAQHIAAVESYQTKNKTVGNTDWPVDAETPPADTTEYSYTIINHLTGDYSYFNGKQCLTERDKSTHLLTGIYVKDTTITGNRDLYVLKPDGSVLQQTGEANFGLPYSMLVSAMGLENVPAILYQTY